MNPYFTAFIFSNQRTELKYGSELQYTDEVQDFISQTLASVFPAEKKRILAVVVRGSDYVFLATEDQAYPDLFLRSELKDRLLCVRLDRGDYTGEENRNKLLLANVSCGVVTYALGRNRTYEFVEVKKIR